MTIFKLTNLYIVIFTLFFQVSSGLCTEKKPIVQIEPAWVIYNVKSRINDKTETYWIYSLYFQRHILEILSSMNMQAIPSLYTSAFQTLYDPRSIQELDELLQYEPKVQRNFCTLIPVIRNSSIETSSKECRIQLAVSIYALEKSGRLGKELLSAKIDRKIENQSSLANSDDFEQQINAIKQELSTQKEWQSIVDYITTTVDDYQSSPIFPVSQFFKEQTTHYFGESDAFYFNDQPHKSSETSSRLHKSNMLIIKATERNDKLLFAFDYADEIPWVQYVYTILPDNSVIQVNNSDIHIEKSPDALPSDTYNSMRYLVINLPGVTSGSIVCYAVKYQDPGFYDSTYFNQYKEKGYRYPLARDFVFPFSFDTNSWQLRIWMPTSTRNRDFFVQGNNCTFTDSQFVLFCQSNQNLQNTSTYKLFKKKSSLSKNPDIALLEKQSSTNDMKLQQHSFQMYIFQGTYKPIPVPVIEPQSYIEPSLLRVSTISSWDSLFSTTRDSIFSILKLRDNRTSVFKHILKKSSTADSSVFTLQNYMADSLRYIHISFNAHKTIPISPDSLLKSKMGDCKDYSTLFISELKQLGIDAVPALVNTNWPNSLAAKLPSYSAFNHMIVYVPKYQWWIDPLYYPIPPSVIPEYLVGLQSLVLYKDSMKVVDIPSNEDSARLASIRYEIGLDATTLTCKYIEHSSIEKSFYIRKYLPQIDSTRHFDFLFPSGKYVKRYSTDELGISFTGLNESTGKITIYRQFNVNNAITSTGSAKLINLPEMPLFSYVSIVSANNRHSDFYMPSNLICNVSLKVTGGYKVQWPASYKNENFGTMLHISQVSNDEIVFSFHVKKGIMSLKEYNTFKLALDSYRNFFSNPVPVQKRRK